MDLEREPGGGAGGRQGKGEKPSKRVFHPKLSLRLKSRSCSLSLALSVSSPPNSLALAFISFSLMYLSHSLSLSLSPSLSPSLYRSLSLSHSPSLYLALSRQARHMAKRRVGVYQSPSYAGARAPRGGVTRQGVVVLTELQSLLDCQ